MASVDSPVASMPYGGGDTRVRGDVPRLSAPWWLADFLRSHYALEDGAAVVLEVPIGLLRELYRSGGF